MSRIPKNTRSDEKSARLITAASFLLSFVLVLLTFALTGIAPFGDKLLLYSDSYSQYASFWAHFRAVVLGERDAAYSMGMVLGGNSLGVFAYYAASPLNLIFALFSQENLPIAMHIIVLLKISLSGMTMAIFFRHTTGLDRRFLLLTAAYSLCAYVTNYFWGPMWLDGVVLLPLIALGLHNIANGKKPWLYILSLAAAILFNYYIGFMLCIFSVLYWVYLMWVLAGGKAPGRSFFVFCLSSLAAGGLSAVLLVPTALTLTGGKRVGFWPLFRQYTYTTGLKLLGMVCPSRAAEFDSLVKYALLAILLIILFAFLALFFVLRSKSVDKRVKLGAAALFVLLVVVYGAVFEPQRLFLQKLFVGMSDFDQMRDGMPHIYSGLLPLILALLYFTDRDISARERWGTAALLLFLLCCMRLFVPNLIWHGLTENNCFNFRYSFIFSFVLIFVAGRALCGLERLSLRRWLPALAAILLFAAAWVLGCYYLLAAPWQYAAVIMIFLIMVLLLHFGALAPIKPHPKAAVVLAALSILSTAYPFYSNITAFSEHDSFLSMASYREETAKELRRAELIKAQADELYRGSVGQDINSAFAYNIGDLSHFSSSEQVKTVRFMGAMGAASTNAWASAKLSHIRALDSLFALRYLPAESASSGCFAGYSALEENIMENPYALPIAFSADSGVLDSRIDSSLPFENLNRAYREIFPDVGMDVFTPLAPDAAPEMVGLKPTGDGSFVPAEQEDGYICFKLSASSKDPIYFYLRDGWLHGDEVYVNGEFFASRSTPYTWSPLCLGCYEPGSTLTVELRPAAEPDLPMAADAVFYVESSDALLEYAEAAKALPCTTRGGGRSISTQATVGEGSCLLYTIPYDSGWSATVDGKPAETFEAFDVLLAVDTGAGEHSVELRYTTPGLRLGAGISLFTALALCAALMISRRRR